MVRDIRMSRILIALVAIVICACGSNEFTMQPYSGWPIQTRILAARHAVERPHGNSVRLRDSARVGMRVLRLTDGSFSTEMRVAKGTMVRLQTRTTPYADSMRGARGVMIDIADGTTTVTSARGVHRAETPFEPDRPFAVRLTNEGRWTVIFVSCVEVARFMSDLPSTEWLIASLPNGGAALIADPLFTPNHLPE